MSFQHEDLATHNATARLSSWFAHRVFIGAAWFTILATLVALIKEMYQVTTNVTRFETLAVLLLVAALCAQLGPSLIYRIKKIVWPVHRLDRESARS